VLRKVKSAHTVKKARELAVSKLLYRPTIRQKFHSNDAGKKLYSDIRQVAEFSYRTSSKIGDLQWPYPQALIIYTVLH